MPVFTRIEEVELPKSSPRVGEAFEIAIKTDGALPFAQIILRHADGWEWIIRDQRVKKSRGYRYRFQVPAEAFHAGTAYLQIEGCRLEDLAQAGPEDWIKQYRELEIAPAAEDKPESPAKARPASPPAARLEISEQPVIYFGIHKHMHQPYYRAAELDHWDGEKDEIFGSRHGPYTHFVPTAVWHYINGGLPHAGLSSSWSGSLLEQLQRCAETGRVGGAFHDWNRALREVAGQRTALDNPRLDFTAFGIYHPLMPLIPDRDIVGQIRWHRELVKNMFGVEASDLLFPPETAFSPHIIPALKEAGVNAVIYDSIHHFRACPDYPYVGPPEGMLPPNPADQINPPAEDWLALNNIWAPSKISPRLLKPCYLVYTDRDNKEHEIIGIPAERYLGNEDARGGYGALQYEQVMGQIYDHLRRSGHYDPRHPPFFLLHSDGDNHGGGADSYYHANTQRLVEMCRNDQRFQLVTVKDYLQRFPVDPANRVHLEAGAWAGADNGDPQYTKWFSWSEKDYSPDINSWAVLTALQNAIYSLEDAGQIEPGLLNELKRLLYRAETSCYWYWTGQEVWDRQVTEAANQALAMAGQALDNLRQNGDGTGPSIFLPWVRPANPGGKDWGRDGLSEAAAEATVRTLVDDISGLKQVSLVYQTEAGKTKKLKMKSGGPYPSRTGPTRVAEQFISTLPAGLGTVRYWVEAVDQRDNVSHSPAQRIHIA